MEPFKNLISKEVVILTAMHLGQHLPDLNKTEFTKSILPRLDALELKQRVRLIAEKMHHVLPELPQERNRILIKMLHPDKLNSSLETSSKEGMCGWGVWPMTEVIGRYGLVDFDGSMSALREITMRGTSEFDVRPFIGADPERALSIMQKWAFDENEHVRRLASEGSRPRLPWGMRLKALMASPTLTQPILHALRDDPSEYVRRSVANHLNDIAKDHPDYVANIASNWNQSASKDRKKLVRHACRGLVKEGHKGALAVFGFLPPVIRTPVINIETPVVEFGDALEFKVSLRSNLGKVQKLVIDYVVHHKKANGKLTPKVFKWKQLTLRPNECVDLTKKHPMRPITTRKYYSGDHALSLRISGVDYCYSLFELKVRAIK